MRVLPLICKAGDITRRDVGSIKIFEDETRFEISAEKAAEYAEKIARGGNVEKGASIAPASGLSQEPRQATPAAKGSDRPKYDGPKYKVRSDTGEKLGTAPATDVRAEPAGKPPRPKDASYTGKPKDKFKAKSKDKHEPHAKAHRGKKHAAKPGRAAGT